MYFPYYQSYAPLKPSKMNNYEIKWMKWNMEQNIKMSKSNGQNNIDCFLYL